MLARIVTLLIFLGSISGFGQTSQEAIEARLLNKPLYLRGLWKEDNIRFNDSGAPRGKLHKLSFTLSGVQITSVELGPKALVLDGVRIGLVFDRSTPQRVPLLLGSEPDLHPEKLHFEIATPSNGDYQQALDNVFTGDLATFVPSLPDEWKNFGEKNLLPNSPPWNPKTELPKSTAKNVGGGVTAPKLLQSVSPKWNEYARKSRDTGTCMVHLVVDEQGKPSQISIVRPLGIGMDERAVLAVRQFVFQPAMEAGRPVAVQLNIEVHFAS